MSDLPDDPIESVSVPRPLVTAPADNSVHDGTGHHRLVEHPQHRPADIEGLQSSQKIETPLVLSVHSVHVLAPVQFEVQVHL